MLEARRGAAIGDHCDHEIVYLPDGRVMAIGIDPAAGVVNPTMVEFYDPAANAWTRGPTTRHHRLRPQTVLLADGRVLAWGGEYNGPPATAPSFRNARIVSNCTNVADLYDPATNAWRPLGDAKRWALIGGSARPSADYTVLPEVVSFARRQRERDAHRHAGR